jgi:hypothetical protein
MDLYSDIINFKKGYQPRTNIVKDEKGDLRADSHSILARWRNHFSQLLNIHGVNDVRHTELHTADHTTGERRKLHNEDLYSSPNIVRVIKSVKMRWMRHVARMGDGRDMYRVLVGKPEGRRPLERPRCRLEDNIKMGV